MKTAIPVSVALSPVWIWFESDIPVPTMYKMKQETYTAIPCPVFFILQKAHIPEITNSEAAICQFTFTGLPIEFGISYLH